MEGGGNIYEQSTLKIEGLFKNNLFNLDNRAHLNPLDSAEVHETFKQNIDKFLVS